MIKLENITKMYKKNKKNIIALNNININFESGKFYAIMGNSGSGKSTLLNIIGLLDYPASGILRINNLNIKHLSQSKLDELKNIVKQKSIELEDKKNELNKNKDKLEALKKAKEKLEESLNRLLEVSKKFRENVIDQSTDSLSGVEKCINYIQEYLNT